MASLGPVLKSVVADWRLGVADAAEHRNGVLPRAPHNSSGRSDRRFGFHLMPSRTINETETETTSGVGIAMGRSQIGPRED